MAPSTRDSANRAQKHQGTIRNYAKVTKVTKVQNAKPSKNVLAQKLQALSDIINEEKPRPASPQLKRKRSDEDEEDATANPEYEANGKVRLTPTALNTHTFPKRIKHKTSTAIPDGIETLRDIFQCFLKAFSIHIAHNGIGSPARLDTLLSTATRLYKKRDITKEDIQRTLALFEVPAQSVLPNRVLLLHKDSPFKLIASGLGVHARHLIEYTSDRVYNEKSLLQDLTDAIETACVAGQNKKESFVHAPVQQYPLLAYEKSAQAAARQHKTSAIRAHILNGAPQRLQKEKDSTEPDFDKLSLNDSQSIEQELHPSSTKSRTLSLFDRVKAKQSAASLTSAPTSAELLRRHAIGRIEDIVEILRMKQTQRASTVSNMSTTADRKVSFSMAQALALIKSSLNVPMADAEIQLCIDILAKEVPGSWLKVAELGNFQSVIIQGQAYRGSEVRAFLQDRA